MTDALIAETITITSGNGDTIEAYSARALDEAPRGGVVVIHHLPGYDDATKEIARKFAYHGYIALQRMDRAMLEPRLPPRIFYNLMLAAQKPE